MDFKLVLPSIKKDIKENIVTQVSFHLKVKNASFDVSANKETGIGSIELVTVIKDDISDYIKGIITGLEKDLGTELKLGKRLAAYLNSFSVSKKYADVLDIPVRELSFQKYIIKQFEDEGFNYVRDIVELNDYHIYAFPKFGERSLKEIKTVLKELGVSLRPTE